jgi:hypothetical protein
VLVALSALHLQANWQLFCFIFWKFLVYHAHALAAFTPTPLIPKKVLLLCLQRV